MMNQKIKVFVTGAGSAVGQSIIKALSLSKLNTEILVGDISDLSSGLYMKDGFIIPAVEKKNSLNWFINFLIKKKINILFIGSEHEIEFFSKNKNKIEEKSKTIICVSNYNIVKTFNNKFSTIEFLKRNKFYYPKTYNIKDINLEESKPKLKYPFFLKDIYGTSSNNVFLVNSFNELVDKSKFLKNPIIQEYLGKKHNFKYFHKEYTCSLFYTKEGKIIGPFISERILKHGTSWIVKSINNNEIKKTLLKIGRKINGSGSLNFQLKKHKNRFYIFEINPRFSGTTSVRAFFGFNEPEMFIKNFFLKKKINHCSYKIGIAFRYFEDIFLNGELKKYKKQRGNILKWF
jgi:carbamoyl-phosphate synthase large subunit